MTRQGIPRLPAAVLVALALTILAGCARQAPNGPAPTPDGEAHAKSPSPEPRTSPPGYEPALKPVVRTPEGSSEQPGVKPTAPEPNPVTVTDTPDRKPAPPARAFEDVLQYVGAFRVPDGKLGDST